MIYTKQETEEIIKNIIASFAFEEMICTPAEIETMRKIISGESTETAEIEKLTVNIVNEYNTSTDHSTPVLLDNKFGITDYMYLERTERKFSTIRTAGVSINPVKGNFDFWLLKDIHKRIFQDVYSWAGECRLIQIKKAGGSFDDFTFPQDIDREARRIFGSIREQHYLIDKDWETSVNLLAVYMGEINRLHPFMEGNGRTERIFISQLAKCAGIDLRWDLTSADEIIEASIASCRGNSAAFRPIFAKIAKPYAPARQLQMLRGTSDKAAKIFEEIHAAYSLPDREKEYQKIY